MGNGSAMQPMSLDMQERNKMETIKFSETDYSNSTPIGEWMKRTRKRVTNWLDTKSEFYSRICEFDCTRRTVIRINLITVCMFVVIGAVEEHPLVALMAAAAAGYIVRRLNNSEPHK